MNLPDFPVASYFNLIKFEVPGKIDVEGQLGIVHPHEALQLEIRSGWFPVFVILSILNALSFF
jgi:hypothetical protein